eukprot:Nk52_evm12s1869 gene=Nk52_evmTU12s1869
MDQYEDTEWNDALRKHGIIPQKPEPEITEEMLTEMIEESIRKKTEKKKVEDMTLDEMDEFEDEEDDRVLAMWRKKRMQEMQQFHMAAKYGSLQHISADEFVEQVNKAGDGVWVIVHLYQEQLPICKLFNERLASLAKKFPFVKFLNIKSTDCIPGYPDKNLPTILVYHSGDLKRQIVGAHEFDGTKTTESVMVRVLSRKGKDPIFGSREVDGIDLENYFVDH